MVGVREGGFGGGFEDERGEAGLVEVEVEVDDGRKEMERVPENRIIDTANATGSTAVKGFG